LPASAGVDVRPVTPPKVFVFHPRFFLFFKTAKLGFEAQSVIALRMMRFVEKQTIPAGSFDGTDAGLMFICAAGSSLRCTAT
jgi:hypothetical protein